MPRRRTKTSEREVTCHEATHGAIAVVLQRPFHHVTVVPEDERGSLGHVLMETLGEEFRPDVHVSPEIERQLEIDIIILLAGGIGGQRAVGSYNPEGCGSDLHQANKLVCYLSGSDEEAEQRLDELWRQAERLVDWAWGAIEVLAAELQARKTLSAAEVREVVGRALPAEPPGASVVLQLRVEKLERDLQELRQRLHVESRILQLPVTLVDSQKRFVAQITEAGELVKLPPIHIDYPDDDRSRGA